MSISARKHQAAELRESLPKFPKIRAGKFRSYNREKLARPELCDYPAGVAKHDYSHLTLKPGVIARSLSLGYRIADETWLAAVRRIEPPIFDENQLRDLRWILDPTIERRGGKSLKSLTKPLLERLEAIDQTQLPKEFLNGLRARLETGKRYTEKDDARAYGKQFWRSDRDRLIVHFYDCIYDHLEDGRNAIGHEVFTSIPMSEKGETRSEKALATLSDFLHHQTIYEAPSEGTLLKIVSEAKHRKRRPKK